MWKIKIKDLLDLQGNLGNLVSLWVFSLHWKKTCILERVIHHTYVETWNCTTLHTVTSYTSTREVLAQQLRRILPALHTCQGQGHGEWQPPENKGKQLLCQHTNALRAAIPPTLGSAAAPSQLSGLNVDKGAELTGLLQWLLYNPGCFTSNPCEPSISIRCMRLKKGAKYHTVQPCLI